MSEIKLKNLRDKDGGELFYPYTHIDAVLTNDDSSTLRDYIEKSIEGLVYNINDIQTGLYIRDDNYAIDSATDIYRLVKFYIDKTDNFYCIFGGNSHTRLVKYTDSTYNTPEVCIKTWGESEEGFMELESGYYILCWMLIYSTSAGIYNPTYINNIITKTSSYVDTMSTLNEIDNLIKYFKLRNVSSPFNVLRDSETVQGYYIADDGVIKSAVYNYITYKFHLDEKTECLFSNSSLNGHIQLAQYTDETYTSMSKIIRSAESYPVTNELIYLNSGYYAFCTDTVSDTRQHVNCGIFNLTLFKTILNYTKESIITPKIIITPNVINAKYINESGVIDSSIDVYRLSYFEIQVSGYYKFDENMNNSHPVLAKFTDETYTICERILIDNITPQKLELELQEGFYAICSQNVYGLESFRIEKIDELSNYETLISNRGKNGIHDFSDFSGNWQKINDNVYQSQATGKDNSFSCSYTTYDDEFIASLEVTPIESDNGEFEILFGKSGGLGTFVKYGKSSEGYYYMKICQETSEHDIVDGTSIILNDLKLGINKPVQLKLIKKVNQITNFSCEISDIVGNKNVIENVDGLGGSNIAGLGYGYLCTFVTKGKFSIRNIHFGYNKESNDIKLLLMGHSFFDGNNSTLARKDLRVSQLVANDIGVKNSLILAQGDGGTYMLESLKKQICWYNSIKYAIIMFGANDYDSESAITQYKKFNEFLTDCGIDAYWLTITPLRDGTISKPNLDNYFRSNFKYIDVKEIFYNEDGSINTSLFSDNIHPTIEGYRRMYNVIKSQCPFLETV